MVGKTKNATGLEMMLSIMEDTHKTKSLINFGVLSLLKEFDFLNLLFKIFNFL